ncbi:MAG: hypothetical protein COA90_00835 [Gammaproteobacteria bacterium]|nr:MAG: hypothetical protein COA90_00835 [Gammaproteobacteria bacterium]
MNNRRTKWHYLLVLLLLSIMNSVYADSQPEIVFEKFWIVAAPDVARSTAGYGVIKNKGDVADTLINIRCDMAMIMLHKTEITSGMAKMIHQSNSVIEAHSELLLEPMSFHLMFMDITPANFSEGKQITVKFEFETSGVSEVNMTVKANNY